MNLEQLLDRPIAFHRPFVELTGSVTAALFLSQAVYWSRRTQDGGGWFWKTQAEWQEETGLSRREQETARRTLVSLGIMEEKLAGVPAILHFRVNAEILVGKLDCTKAPSQYGGNRQTRMAESAKLSNKEQRLQTETTTETKETPFIPLKGNEKKRSGFVVPSLDEVTEYAFEIGMTAGDGESFHDHFTANGWKVGKGGLPMKDWKAAMRNWKRNAAKFSQTVQKKETFEERMVRLGLA